MFAVRTYQPTYVTPEEKERQEEAIHRAIQYYFLNNVISVAYKFTISMPMATRYQIQTGYFTIPESKLGYFEHQIQFTTEDFSFAIDGIHFNLYIVEIGTNRLIADIRIPDFPNAGSPFGTNRTYVWNLIVDPNSNHAWCDFQEIGTTPVNINAQYTTISTSYENYNQVEVPFSIQSPFTSIPRKYKIKLYLSIDKDDSQVTRNAGIALNLLNL